MTLREDIRQAIQARCNRIGSLEWKDYLDSCADAALSLVKERIEALPVIRLDTPSAEFEGIKELGRDVRYEAGQIAMKAAVLATLNERKEA